MTPQGPLSSLPLHYLLTFRTYGTWLPGDARGWHRRGDHGEHRPPSFPLADWAARRMKFRPVWFSERERCIVYDAIVATCAWRAYELHAHTVQRNHVHAVVSTRVAPSFVLGDLKRYATRALRTHGLRVGRLVWATHGSTRFLPDDRAVHRAVRYVLDDHHRPLAPTVGYGCPDSTMRSLRSTTAPTDSP